MDVGANQVRCCPCLMSVLKFRVSRRKNSLIGRLFFLATCGFIGCNVFFTILSTRASMANYPGGQALLKFHQLLPARAQPSPHVHISNLAAQTGASLFLQLNAPPHSSGSGASPWIYNKTENLSSTALSSSSSPFTHLISETSPASDRTLAKHWRTLATIKGFDRWAVNWSLLFGKPKGELFRRFPELLIFEQSDKLWILERKA